ncbi:unnamed protein product [Adineta steineri]|uniref:Uncharacterized protein n=1 Tax=Adineta steineri TaxID=433720 RepID=A0A814QBP7_9BILA|nr:unnamed protein product [Adineta steineri]
MSSSKSVFLNNIVKNIYILSELKIIKEQAEGKLPSADNDKQKQQLQLEIKIPGNLLEYVQMYYDDVINNSIEHKHMDETIDKVAKT